MEREGGREGDRDRDIKDKESYAQSQDAEKENFDSNKAPTIRASKQSFLA